MSVRFQNLDETSEPFFLRPGSYFVTYASNWSHGEVTLQRQNDDGTWADALVWNADGELIRDLAGIYRLLIAGGATAVNAAFMTRSLY